MTEQEQTQPQTPTPEQEVGEFISRMTEGLEEKPTANTESQSQPATPEMEDQGSKSNASEGAPDKGSQSPEEVVKDGKTQSETAPAPKEDKQTVDVEEHFDKSSKAFAQLRIENKQKDADFLRLAKLAGFDAKTPEEARAQLDIHMTKYEAKKQNVDPLVLQQLQQREAQIAEQEKLQLRQEARTGFDKLKTQFNLDETKLVAFAQQLQTAGINPFEQRVNLEHEYKLRNYDTLLAAAREAGRQEEIARRTKAQTSATVPSGKVGGTQDTGESIDSVEKLRAFLESK